MEEVLRKDGRARIVLCRCGRLHFTYGPLTLRFSQEEFMRFTESVNRLAAQVRQTLRTASPTASLSSDTSLCH